MINIRTTNNDSFKIKWAGVATIDGVLRFAITDASLTDIIAAFTDTANCATLTRVFDNSEQNYEGYTVFRGVKINYDGDIIVSMSKI